MPSLHTHKTCPGRGKEARGHGEKTVEPLHRYLGIGHINWFLVPDREDPRGLSPTANISHFSTLGYRTDSSEAVDLAILVDLHLAFSPTEACC